MKRFFLIYIIRPCIIVFSRLPLRFLYGISTGLYYILYYCIGYRKKVVKKNLTIAYPFKNKREIQLLTKKTLRHFCDFLIEVIAFFTLSDKALEKRYKCIDDRLIKKFKKQGRSFIIFSTHYANWEWSGFLPTAIDCPVTAPYTPVSNPYLNEIVVNGRTRKNFHLIPSNKAIQTISQHIRMQKTSGYLMISDQSPVPKKSTYYTSFFGKKVPVHTGAEVIAIKYNLPVVFLRVKRISRGYYEFSFEEICSEPTALKPYQITEKYIAKTMQAINEAPAFYLWTHRRFKHARD